MNSDPLEIIRKQLDSILSEASQCLDSERSSREQQLAHAMENLTQESACQAAYRDGRQDERHRVICLIDDHLHTLRRGGMNAMALEALRKTVGEL
jgi:hypothetical protein